MEFVKVLAGTVLKRVGVVAGALGVPVAGGDTRSLLVTAAGVVAGLLFDAITAAIANARKNED